MIIIQRWLRTLIPLLLSSTLAATACARKEEKEILTSKLGTTNEQGITNLDFRIKVRDENGPLKGIFVYQVEGNNDAYFFLAWDPKKKYYPERMEFGEGSSQQGLKRSALIGELEFILDTVDAFNYAREDAKKQEQYFMGDDRNVNKYCMPLEQITESHVDVPLGIIGVLSEDIQTAAATPLRWLFEHYVTSGFGKQAGYEVWVPKTVTNLCNESYEGVVCTIDTEILSEGLWAHQHIPAWEIKGACTPMPWGTDERETRTNSTRSSTPSSSNNTPPPQQSRPQSTSSYAACYSDNQCGSGKSCETVCITKHDGVIYDSPRFSCEEDLCEKASGGIAECRSICR